MALAGKAGWRGQLHISGFAKHCKRKIPVIPMNARKSVALEEIIKRARCGLVETDNENVWKIVHLLPQLRSGLFQGRGPTIARKDLWCNGRKLKWAHGGQIPRSRN